MAWDTDATRRRLREAALIEFADHGLDGTSIAAITERAGVNRERLYSYFGDKAIEEHADELAAEVLATELEKLAAAIRLTGVGLDDVGQFVGATFDYHAAHPELGRLLQWEGLQHRPAANVDERAVQYREKVERFAHAQESGQLDPVVSPAHLVFALIALAAWWQTVPHLAEMITGASSDDVDELGRRRAFTVDAARRMAAPRGPERQATR